jgi:single-stranded DNA-binding protein
MVVELGRLMYDVKIDTVICGDKEKKVLNNRLAIKNGSGKDTQIDLVAWESRAEFISKYFKKGFEILVEGQLINSTKKKENVEYETVTLLVDSVKFTHGNPREYDGEIPDFLK